MKDFLKQLKAVTNRKSIIIAIVVLVMYTVISGFYNPPMLAVGIFIIAAYIAAAFFILRRDIKTEGLFAENSAMLGITFDFVTNFSSPIIIINDKGQMIWYNKAFIQKADSRHSLYGKEVTETVNNTLTPSRIEFLKSGATYRSDFNGTEYEIAGYNLSSAGKNYSLLVFTDKTEIETAKRELEQRNAVVAYILLDNISESLYFAEDKYRSISAQIAVLISEWCKKLGGIVKEYEKDKFLLVFEERKLPDILEGKFDILDSIRECEIDGSNLTVTASIGMSNIPGSFSEKEAAARSALDSALHRGGDQAVFKTESSTEYYGGRSKTVQKKSKIRSRIVAGELCDLIRQSGNVIIMGHRFCDHDSIASCACAARIASHLGKEAKIVVNIHDANLKPIFAKMRGQTYYQDLFTDAITAQDMMRSDTLVIICDTNNPDLFESKEIFESSINYVIIDHHRKVQEEYVITPRLSYIEPSASSASELMSEIAEYALPQGALTSVEADLLFAGIILDTNNFRKNTGVKTFSAALFLRSQGADPSEAQMFFRTNFDDFIYETKFDNITTHPGGIIIASSNVESDDPSRTKLVSSKTADKLLAIAGTEAAFVLAPIGNDINVSARSTGKSINVQLILESLGGGGHFDAAGAVIKDADIIEARQTLLSAIENYKK